MGQALYRTYRARSLDEVIGQTPIVVTLSQSIKQRRISHAYLFTGPRGVGKTSVARIFAHAINELDYTDDRPHIDIIEIDAASNRRIDEIRELRDTVHIAPTQAKYKVYIIDEAHMLTREAFNALLKTLEEPPAHVVFILATTDASKLPETIISRTQRFYFKPAETADILTLLKKVAAAEKIKTTDDGLRLLAEHSEGSFRDSLSLLDQARNHSTVVNQAVLQSLLGLPSSEALLQLTRSVQTADVQSLVTQLDDFYSQGFQASTIARLLGKHLRKVVLEHPNDVSGALALLEKLIAVPAAYDPERYLEIVLLEAATANAQPVVSVRSQEETVEVAPVETISKKAVDANKPDKPVELLNNEELWAAFLNTLKQTHNTLYGVIRMAKPQFVADNVLELTFMFPFHQKKLNEPINRHVLEKTIADLSGQAWTIKAILDKKQATSTDQAAQTAPSADLSTISNIFEGAELLES
jgi:DNA polymerase-3 subunit gamma/tau